MGLIRALNAGARLAGGEFLCFLHNDTEMRDRGVAGAAPRRGGGRRRRGAGRSLRRAAAPRRRTLRGAHHRVEPGGRAAAARARDRGGGGGRRVPLPPPRAARRRSAASTRATASSTATTASSRSRCGRPGNVAWWCARLSFTGAAAPAPGGEPRAAPAQDLAERRAALTRFAARWRHRLPSDVRPLRERLADRLRAPLNTPTMEPT